MICHKIHNAAGNTIMQSDRNSNCFFRRTSHASA